MSKRKQRQINVTITKQWQALFIVVVFLSWLVPLTYITLFSAGNLRSEAIYAQIITLFLPAIFFLVSLIYAWGKHAALLATTFMATFIATIGFTAYYFISAIESAIRYKFFPPNFETINENSLLAQFGHELLVIAVCLATFTAFLVFAHRQPSKK